MKTQFQIEVRVRMPWSPEPVVVAVEVSDLLVRDSFAPLPRGRELHFDMEAYRIAERMMANRRQLTGELAKRLTGAILKAVQSRDPQNGYSPEEWAEICPNPCPSVVKG